MAMIQTFLGAAAFAALLATGSHAAEAPSNPDLDRRFLSELGEAALASQWIGEIVYASEAENAETIGEIEDLLVSSDGDIDAAVVAVGGFLGVGEKHVAVSFESLKFVSKDGGDSYVVLETTKEELESAPQFDVQAQVAPDTPAADDTTPAPSEPTAGTTAVTPETVPPPMSAPAMTDEDCNAAWVAADANKDGALDENEKARYVAALRVGDHPVATDATMTQEVFIENCKAGHFQTTSVAPEAGAPFEGANSFTEGQAQDRVLAAGYTNVSALKQDDKGIWRGTAQAQGKEVAIAVDFKGNVVADNK
jgi:hypothetical protein